MLSPSTRALLTFTIGTKVGSAAAVGRSSGCAVGVEAVCATETRHERRADADIANRMLISTAKLLRKTETALCEVVKKVRKVVLL